ncbi:MAG: hypothetical protein KAX05_05675 [Bacteroidales bacterium]|nr:hypothetical protein [Bacteroidales bacterium]
MRKNAIILLSFFVIILAILTIVSCQKDEEPPSPDEIIIAKEVKVITNQTWDEQFISIDSTNYTITFSKNILTTQQFKAGDIIVSTIGEGLLRRVKNVRTVNNEIIVETESASLTDVIQQGLIEFNQLLTVSQIKSIDYHYAGIKLITDDTKSTDQTKFEWAINAVLYDKDGNLSTTSDQIKLIGNFDCYWRISGKIDIEWFGVLKEVKFGFESGENLDLQLIASLQYNFEKKVTLATVNFTPIFVTIGILPVEFTPQLKIIVGIDGSANASITTGIEQSMTFNAGIKYLVKEGWSPYQEFNKSFNFQPPQLNSNASAEAYIKPELLLKVYHIAGPYANLKLYGRVDANLLQTPWWELYAGITMNAGAKVDIIDNTLFDYSVNNIIKYEQLLAQATTSQVSLPTVTTNNVTNFTSTSATVGGNVTSDGGATVTERGVYWGTSQNPESTGAKRQIGSGTGSFSTTLSGLNPNTTYYVKAYAINSQGKAYATQVSFKTHQNITIPTVTTSSVSDIAETSATVGGNVTDNGGATVTERGVYWDTSQNPETTGTKLQIGSGTGTYSTSLTGLTASTTYYIKAYAINNQGEALGSEVSFTTNSGSGSETGTVTDYDGNTYKTVKIGNQTWMAENLKTTNYADGTPLIEGTVAGDLGDDYSTKYWFVYNDNPLYKDLYGLLYTHAAVLNGSTVGSNENPSGIQGICPIGWHVPSDPEWYELIDFLGGQDIAGGKLKETGTSHWASPNEGATNETGFTALPTGLRYKAGNYEYLNRMTGFFSTRVSSTHQWTWQLWDFTESFSTGNYYKGMNHAFSVRCVKD